MKRISTPVAFIIGLIWLAPALSVEAATIPLFSDDPRCRRHQIRFVLSPAGMGTLDLRLDPVSTGKCAAAVGGNSHTPFLGGGFGGGGGGVGGFPSGRFPGVITPPFGALESENQFLLEPPTDLFDSPLSFDGDTPPTGSGGGNGGTTGFIGGSPGLPPNSALMMFPLLLDEDLDQTSSGNASGPQSLDNQHLTAVPEPGSFLLFATGLALAVRRFRRR